MRTSVVVSERGRFALDERVQLVNAASSVDDVIVAESPTAALRGLRSVPRGSVPYLLDVNRITAATAVALAARHRPYVLDTGDDPATLARSTRGALASLGFGITERAVLRNAVAVVCRGSFHQPILRAKATAPICWAPDTVPDALIDDPIYRAPVDTGLIATFGSATKPPQGDRAYGWEVVDVVAATPGLRGVIVAKGTGLESLQARAARRAVSSRVDVIGPLPLSDLARRISPAAFLTSLQSDDVAGWVRTTGKLPVCLGLGKALITTRVGEATRLLPDRFLISPSDDEGFVKGIGEAIRGGVPAGWADDARALAEGFRRTTVAASLRRFLDSL